MVAKISKPKQINNSTEQNRQWHARIQKDTRQKQFDYKAHNAGPKHIKTQLKFLYTLGP